MMISLFLHDSTVMSRSAVVEMLARVPVESNRAITNNVKRPAVTGFLGAVGEQEEPPLMT